jgi:hypothetical protein
MALVKINLSGHFNDILEQQGYIFPGTLQVRLEDENLPQKIVEFLSTYITSNDVVECVLPGLAPLVPLVLAAIHGISGSFPSVVLLKRTDEGFVPGEPLDLQDFRNGVARSKGRANVIEL